MVDFNLIDFLIKWVLEVRGDEAIEMQGEYRVNIVLVTFTCYDQTAWSTATWEGKGLYYHITVHYRKKPRQELKEGARWPEMKQRLEKCCLLTFLFSPDHFPWYGTTCTGLDPPTSIITQENVPQTCTRQGQHDRGSFSLMRISFPWWL